MTKREFLDKVFALAPNEANAIMNAFDEYVDSNEPHWIPVTKPPKDRRICYVTLKDTNDENRQNWVAEMIYTPWDGFNLMDGLEALAWMPKKYPEPYKGVTT